MSASSRSNRLWAALAGLACLGLVALYTSLVLPPVPASEIRPSTFFTNDSGAKACFLVLEEIFPGARRWRNEPGLLNLLADTDEAVASLIVFGPSRSLTPSQADALDRWMDEGGQVILATDRAWPIVEREKLWTAPTTGGKTEEDAAQSPPTMDYLSRHGFRVVAVETGEAAAESPPRVENGRLETGDYAVLAEDGTGVLAGAREVGSGRLVVIPDGLAFSNQRLRQYPGNMTFLVRLLDDASEPGLVAIDEFHHGFEGQRPFMSLLGSFLASAWGLAALQLAVAGLIYLMGTRRRFGPVLEEAEPPVRDPLSLVEARAGLFQAGQARSLAVELIDRHRQRRLARLTGPQVPGVQQHPTPEYQRILEAARHGGGQLRDADLSRFGRMAEDPQGAASE